VRSSAAPQAALGAWLALAAAPATFALVGVSSTAIDVAIFWTLVELAQVPPLVANAISYSTGAINSFLLNKFVTFRDRTTCRGSGEQLVLFIAVRLACLAIASLVLAVALRFMPSIPAKLVSIVVTFVVAYALSSRLVFR
jgi:putative flippase GtrA